ncbi:DUF2922 domain-containing protein [Clostridium ganghwense]|uniref:DUF2922 domain-containing protein n=1 Tax=Clostridium ganghwense TaxID=312089 RepID=A0ABT4CQE1_9CLOT|nr:DUF2922 domain-containing protein [Clostridium ganghwense]MCY6370214.1 DUF2922 domain-containing protein [Clostridium ganghwense]
MGKTLVMNFLTSGGKKTSLSFKNVKDDLKPTDVSNAMDTIIEKNIFMTSSGELKIKDSAQVVDKVIQELDI